MTPETWTNQQVADHLGVQPSTIRAYAARGQMPAPDATTEPTVPRWHADTIRAWRPRKDQP